MIQRLLDLEPVRVAAFARACLYLVALFGVDLEPEAVGAVVLIVETLAMLWTRARVTPVVTVESKVTDAAAKTASRLDQKNAGPAGTITGPALDIIDKVVDDVIHRR